MRKKLFIAFISCLLVCSALLVSAMASSKSVATNGNQKIKIEVKVTDEDGNALKGADVSMSAKDYNFFAKTPNLKLSTTTDNKGVATFKISSTYDRVTGYSVSKEDINTVEKSPNDFIGLTLNKRVYNVSSTWKTFTVKFYDASDNVIKEGNVVYGQSAEAPDAPEYNGELNYKMAFTGWDTDYSNVTEDLNVYPVYDKSIKETYYQLRLVNPLNPSNDSASLAVSNVNPKFVDIFADKDIVENANGVVDMGDGTTVAIEDQMRLANYKINVAPSNASRYYGETNEDGTQTVVYVADADTLYKTSFESIDWNRIKRSAGQIFGTADEWTAYHAVRFYDAAGNVVDTQFIADGQSATAPEGPKYNGTSMYKMAFTGWDTDFSNVTSALNVYPVYEKTSKAVYYQLRLVNPVNPSNDSASLAVSNVNPKFVDIFADKDIVENGDGVVDMEDGTTVTIENQMRIANYKINVAPSNASRYYGETNEDGTQTVVYVADADTLYKTSFESIDWNRIKRSAGQIFGTADEWTVYHAVRFYDAAGNVIDTQFVEDGQSATAPETPAYNGTSKYVMVFSGWDTDYSNVTSALNVKPVYEHPNFTVKEYRPLACFYIQDPCGRNLCVTNDWKRITYVFASNEDVYEDENGQVDMGDGTFITLDELTDASQHLTLNKNAKYAGYYSLSDGILTYDDGNICMTVDVSTIDWTSLIHDENGHLIVYGTAVWTNAGTTEADEA